MTKSKPQKLDRQRIPSVLLFRLFTFEIVDKGCNMTPSVSLCIILSNCSFVNFFHLSFLIYKSL